MGIHHKKQRTKADSDSIMIPHEKHEECNDEGKVKKYANVTVRKTLNQIKKNPKRVSFYFDESDNYTRKLVIPLCNILRCSQHKILVDKYLRNSDRHCQTEEYQKEFKSDLSQQEKVLETQEEVEVSDNDQQDAQQIKMKDKEADSTSKLNRHKKNTSKLVIRLCNVLFCSQHKTLADNCLKTKKSDEHIQGKAFKSHTKSHEKEVHDNEREIDDQEEQDEEEDDSDSDFDETKDKRVRDIEREIYDQEIKMKCKEADSTSKLNRDEKKYSKLVIRLCNVLLCSQHKTLADNCLKTKKSDEHIQGKAFKSHTKSHEKEDERKDRRVHDIERKIQVDDQEEESEDRMITNSNDTKEKSDTSDSEESEVEYDAALFEQREDDSDSNFEQKEDDSHSDLATNISSSCWSNTLNHEQKEEDSYCNLDESEEQMIIGLTNTKDESDTTDYEQKDDSDSDFDETKDKRVLDIEQTIADQEEVSEGSMIINSNDTTEESDTTDSEQKEGDSERKDSEVDSDTDFDQKEDSSDSDFEAMEEEDEEDTDDERKYRRVERKIKHVHDRKRKKSRRQTRKRSTESEEPGTPFRELTDYEKFIAKKRNEKIAFLQFLKSNDEEFDKAFAETPKKKRKKRETKPKLPIIVKKSSRLKNRVLIPLNEAAITKKVWGCDDEDFSDDTYECAASNKTDDSHSTDDENHYREESEISLKEYPLKRSSRLKDLNIDFSERALFEKAVRKDYCTESI